ncbi:MAG: trypsin-like serine protease [Ruminococcus sp.]|nr:trypsin-like serine protease [Ruminococcus sp.]MDE7099503.1 trypsin-like serine protease [Ruminococcus sp.]
MNKFKKQFSGVLATTAVLLCSSLSPFASASAATTSILLGDANGDGYVNIADATFIAQYLGGKYVVNAKNFTAMDVNEDGVIDETDQRMIQYLEAGYTSSKIGTIVNKTCYTLPLSNAVQYRRHDCSDSNLKSYKTYTIPVGESTNAVEDIPVAYASQDNTKDNENIACVEISSSIGVGSGFIVSNNTIATAAHCIYNDSSNEFAKNVKVKVYVDENVSYTASAEFLHMPSKYINGNDCDVNYDYALIRVGDFKDKNGNKVNVGKYSVNLGIMTDEFINAKKGSLTSVGYTTIDNIHTRYQSTGVISPDIPSHEYAYRYHIESKGGGGKSGGMTYFDSSYTFPGSSSTINTRSTVGVHTSGGDGHKSYGVRVNLNLIRFYKMSKLFEGA